MESLKREILYNENTIDTKNSFILNDVIKSVNTPTKEENERLIRLAQSGDKKAMDEAIIRNGKLVPFTIGRLFKNMNEDVYEDVMQEGFIGLKRAVEAFEPSKGSFSTYACLWIRQRVERYVQDTRSDIRIPIFQSAKYIKIEKELKTQMNMYSDVDIAYKKASENLGMSISEMKEIQSLMKPLMSMDMKVKKDDGDEDTTIGSLVKSKDDVENEVVTKYVNKDLQELMKDKLTEKEYRVIKLRFGFEDGRPRTLEEVGKLENVTRERIRQIQNKALGKLRCPSIKKILAM